MDKALEEVIKKLSENPNNKIIQKEVITFYNGVGEAGFGEKVPIPVVTLNLTDKYAEFHDEYTIIAPEIGELKPLMEYIQKNGFNSNLD